MRVLSRYSLAGFCCAIFFVLVSAQERKMLVYGVVVDDKGRPAVGANVTFDRSELAGDNNCVPTENDVKTDAGGHFSNSFECKSGQRSTIIFVEAAPDTVNTTFPLFAPFWPALRRSNPRFAGTTVELRGDKSSDLGKIPVQIWYNRAELFVHDKRGRPFYRSDDDWARFVLIVRDESGEAVGSTGLSTLDRQRSVRIDRGSIMLALPEGTWTLELLNDWHDFDQRGRTLKRLGVTKIVVEKADVCLQATLIVE